MSNKLFVGGLSWDTKEDSLKALFEQAGKVLEAKIITDKFSGKSKGFGFVTMETEEDAQKSIKKEFRRIFGKGWKLAADLSNRHYKHL
jgi:cold-inducible RNA-binding protein